MGAKRSLVVFLTGTVAVTLCWILIAVRVQEAAISQPESEPDPSDRVLLPHYAIAKDARSAGVFERSGLPDIIPDDAKDVWEWGREVCFTAPSGLESVRSALTQRGAKRVPWHPTEEWGPRLLAKPETEPYELADSSGSSVVVGLTGSTRTVCLFRRLAPSVP